MNAHNPRFPKTDRATGPESFEEIACDMQRILRESNAALRESNAVLRESNAALRENSRKLDALMKHLGVPYEKPPTE